MRNSIWIFLYIALLVLIVFFEFNQTKKSNNSLALNSYKIEENKALDKIFLEYIEPLDKNSVSNKQWGIVIKKKILKKEKNITKTKEVKKVLVTLKGTTLCIEKECFKLLGIFSNHNLNYASFYNKKSKKKIKTFRVGDILGSTVKIETIVKKKVIFKDINSSRVWHMKLFDVNSSKYRPKEFE
ncbi:hypothetical protein MNB_SV-13-1306 [hydrothermal vent metagenome]|uniref:Uncharacterized protein n=1 Tax=hydrothermal vent metagenome TaxID=652676 RepID=A0A1W1D091_9ZZZZ